MASSLCHLSQPLNPNCILIGILGDYFPKCRGALTVNEQPPQEHANGHDNEQFDPHETSPPLDGRTLRLGQYAHSLHGLGSNILDRPNETHRCQWQISGDPKECD